MSDLDTIRQLEQDLALARQDCAGLSRQVADLEDTLELTNSRLAQARIMLGIAIGAYDSAYPGAIRKVLPLLRKAAEDLAEEEPTP